MTALEPQEALPSEGSMLAINLQALRHQTRHVMADYCQLQLAMGATEESVQALRDAVKAIRYSDGFKI